MIVFKDDYIIVKPKYKKTEKHKHSMIHIIASDNDIEVNLNDFYLKGKLVLINKDVEHKIKLNSLNSVVILIDSSSMLAEMLKEMYFTKHEDIVEIDCDSFAKSILEYELSDINLYNIFNLNYTAHDNLDIRVDKIINNIKSGKYNLLIIQEIAQELYLSPSRLTHLFKQQTGMSIKNYILMNRLRNAYKIVLSGASITKAAMDTGFSDSSHLSAVAKKTTGIAISSVVNHK